MIPHCCIMAVTFNTTKSVFYFILNITFKPLLIIWRSTLLLLPSYICTNFFEHNNGWSNWIKTRERTFPRRHAKTLHANFTGEVKKILFHVIKKTLILRQSIKPIFVAKINLSSCFSKKTPEMSCIGHFCCSVHRLFRSNINSHILIISKSEKQQKFETRFLNDSFDALSFLSG